MSARHSMLVSKNDNEQYSTFKARREAEKEAKRALLAKEFPLLFGSDSKSRSTIGKYANKTVPTNSHNPITPGKRRTQSTLGMKPISDENVDGNGATSVGDKRVSCMVKIDQGKDRKKSGTFGKTVQSPNKRARQTIAATANSRGSFLNYGAFSSKKSVPVGEVEMFGQEKDVKVPEIQDEISVPEYIVNTDDVFEEQVTDVLDYLLETKEVDQVTHRRLSSQGFDKESIRRISMRASLSAPVTEETQSATGPEDVIKSQEPSHTANDASFDIDDYDVLQALRTYISTLDDVNTSTSVSDNVHAPSRGVINGFASPTPNTQVISITSPNGSHFKRPKQLSSPNPIRFGSRHRRESGLDVEIPTNELRTAVKTPPTTKNHKSVQPISPNPMRLADAFRRGSVSGRKSSRNSTIPQQNHNLVEDDDVLGLMNNFDEPSFHQESSTTTLTSAQKKKSKKQRRRSSAAGQLLSPGQVEAAKEGDDMFGPMPRKSILNSPSLKTMRVSFISNGTLENSTAKNTSTAAISSQFSSSEMISVIEESSSQSDKDPVSTASLVAILDTIIDAPISPPIVEEIPSSAPEFDSSASTVSLEEKENMDLNVLSKSESSLSKGEIETSIVPLPVSEVVVVACTEIPSKDVTSTVPSNDVAPPAVEDEIVLFFPRQNTYLEAMKKGVVVAELSRSIHSVSNKSAQQQPQHNVRYMIHVSMLPLPGNPTSYETLNMVLVKRFSEFRQFHQKLVACPGVNIERIPVLPTRQIASFGGGNSDADYLKSREKYLRNWLEAVFLRQSFENDAYRQILLDFLSQ